MKGFGFSILQVAMATQRGKKLDTPYIGIQYIGRNSLGHLTKQSGMLEITYCTVSNYLYVKVWGYSFLKMKASLTFVCLLPLQWRDVWWIRKITHMQLCPSCLIYRLRARGSNGLSRAAIATSHVVGGRACCTALIQLSEASSMTADHSPVLPVSDLPVWAVRSGLWTRTALCQLWFPGQAVAVEKQVQHWWNPLSGGWNEPALWWLQGCLPLVPQMAVCCRSQVRLAFFARDPVHA